MEVSIKKYFSIGKTVFMNYEKQEYIFRIVINDEILVNLRDNGEIVCQCTKIISNDLFQYLSNIDGFNSQIISNEIE
jgi:hypothetical protein